MSDWIEHNKHLPMAGQSLTADVRAQLARIGAHHYLPPAGLLFA